MTELYFYHHTEDMGEISGMGGEYEQACQDMLDAGVRWSLDHADADLQIGSYDGIFGLVDFINPAAKELEKVLLGAADGPSGAMMQILAERIFFIHHNSWDEYCKQLREAVAREETSDPSMVDPSPPVPVSDSNEINLLDALQHTFGSANVHVINSPDDLDKLFKAIGFDKPEENPT